MAKPESQWRGSPARRAAHHISQGLFLNVLHHTLHWVSRFSIVLRLSHSSVQRTQNDRNIGLLATFHHWLGGLHTTGFDVSSARYSGASSAAKCLPSNPNHFLPQRLTNIKGSKKNKHNHFHFENGEAKSSDTTKCSGSTVSSGLQLA